MNTKFKKQKATHTQIYIVKLLKACLILKLTVQHHSNQNRVLLVYGKMYRSRKSFQGGAVLKNLPANAGHTGDTGLILWLGRSPGNDNPLQEMTTHSRNFLAQKIPWTEEPGYSPCSCEESDKTERLVTHTCRSRDSIMSAGKKKKKDLFTVN